jgi:TonB-dependent receptor
MMGRAQWWVLFAFVFAIGTAANAQPETGSIRGAVTDKDFGVPLSGVSVTVVELQRSVITGDQGNYVVNQIPQGKYTVTFSKEGYVRQVRADVLVAAGQLSDLDVSLTGEFTEMDEFVVQDVLQAGAGTEAALLQLRVESATLLDSIGADLISRAAASDAAGALRLVSGATVQDGKYAVVRGLPDRYVSSQLNGVRLPTADENKRAVQLDQFPAAIIESIQVSKTFTPDQQGDASGGAVDVRLKSIPEEATLQVKSQVGYNTQVSGRSDFLSYRGGGVNFFGFDDGDRDPQLGSLGGNWKGAAGVKETDSPIDYKWSVSGGGKHELGDGVKVGGYGSFFYEHNSAFYDNGIDNSLWQNKVGGPLEPQTYQGTPQDGDFKTGLFDVTQGRESVRWGALGTVGIETQNHSIGLTYLYTHVGEDVATLAIDTRGKEFFFPGYDPNDPMGVGNNQNDVHAAPYLRLETLDYTERTTETFQVNGKHKFPIADFGGEDATFKAPEVDWFFASSSAELREPDKRQFGAQWLPPYFSPGFPPQPPSVSAPLWIGYKPSANFTLGNFQRIFKNIDEDSDQYAINAKLGFKQWTDTDGYIKFGGFHDTVDRHFNQDTFSNFGDNSGFSSGFDQPWSEAFPNQNHPITASNGDIDYNGEQRLSAGYAMVDLPFTSFLKVVGGARYETVKTSITNKAEPEAVWFPEGQSRPVDLHPGDADVDFSQDDVLPSVGLEAKPIEPVTLRAGFSQTIARQTFKELSPILQQEFLGGPIFIGNPNLKMASLDNYDLRADYTPYEGGLLSASYFYKDVSDPIEYVQRFADFTYTTPVNYPKGYLDGYELEVRQKLGYFWDELEGLGVGANATFIDSEVTLPKSEIHNFAESGVRLHKRDATGAPEHLYNFNVTYDLAATDTQFGLFYTVQGDTLIAGATQTVGHFVPNVYAKEYDTLNVSIAQKIAKYFRIQVQGKNLTNPKIETVYRGGEIGDDRKKTSYTRGIEYTLSLVADIPF